MLNATPWHRAEVLPLRYYRERLRGEPERPGIKRNDNHRISLEEAGLSCPIASLLRPNSCVMNSFNESLWGLEYLRLLASPIFRGEGVPHGDNQWVALVPGLGGGGWCFRYVMSPWLRRIGYIPLEANIGVNFWHPRDALEELDRTVAQGYALTGKPGYVVGHSYGGMLAKEYIDEHPDKALAAVALASPLSRPVEMHPFLMATVRFVTAMKFDEESILDFIGGATSPSKAPTYALWASNDGVVKGKGCKVDGGVNIEVKTASHMGMIANEESFENLAHILSYPRHYFN